MTSLSLIGNEPAGAPAFDTGFHTDWVAIRAASQPDATAAAALERLCRTYWIPLYAYARRRGHSPPDAQDLTQEFFARLLATPWLEDLHPTKGKFRAFLLASMNRFLANQRRHAQAGKRGGGSRGLSFDALEAEHRLLQQPARDDGPDLAFERQWALALLERGRARLQAECEAAGKGRLFEELQDKLEGERNEGYAAIAERLGSTPGAVKKAAQRLRERYQTLLRDEIARTVSRPEDVDEELRCLFAALQS